MNFFPIMPHHWKLYRSGKHGAFSLIEVLVVAGIIGFLAVIAVPSLKGVLDASRTTRGIETIAGALSSARQLAVTKNRQMEIRLISCTDPSMPGSPVKIRGIQVLEVGETGRTPIGKVRMLPSGIIVGDSRAISSLADLNEQTAGTGDPRIAGVSTYKYRSFLFLNDGSLNLKQILPASVQSYFLTVFDEKEESNVAGSKPPPNFATIQLQPATGATTIYRP